MLVRRVDARAGTLVVACAPRLGGDTGVTGAFVDPASRALVFHRRDVALALLADGVIARAGVAPADGVDDDVAHVGPVRGRLEAEHDGVAHLVVAFGASLFEALARARAHAAAPEDVARAERRTDGRCPSSSPPPIPTRCSSASSHARCSCSSS